MNNLENNYCEECDYNNLEINFKKYKNKKDIEEKNKNYNLKFIPTNLESLPKQFCNLCNEISHKINNCPLLSDNFNFDLHSQQNNINKVTSCFKKTSNCLEKQVLKKCIIKKSILRNRFKTSDNFDLCNHFSNFTLNSGKSKKVSFNFNLSTTH